MHVHVLVLVLVLVIGCDRPRRDEPARGIKCASDRDCPGLPAGSTCEYACGPDVCQLITLGAHLGDGPCFGNHRDGARAIAIQTASRVVVACDVAAGLHCDRSSRHCVATQPLGAACTDDDACGIAGRCDDNHQICVAAHRAGESCRTERCAAGLYCDASTHCAPRHDIGAACELGEECSSLVCDHEHCIEAARPLACPIAI